MGSVTAEINQVYRLKTDKLVPCKDPHLAVRMQKPFFPGSYVKGKVVEGFQCRISGHVPRPAPGRKPAAK